MNIPDAVQIREVGPRDGFQNELEIVPTERKIELIDMLARTGLRRLEVTSFVRADVIPQLADATDVLARIDVPEEVAVGVLIPNERGLERALELRDGLSRKRPAFDEINVFLSASETHNRHNVNRSIEESLVSLEKVLPRARARGLRCEAVISTSFGCPYEGRVPPERVLDIAARLRDVGAQEIGFGDTTGMANPVQVGAFFEQAFKQLGAHGTGKSGGGESGPSGSARGGSGNDARVQLTAHFHNTRGQGLANVLGALQAGVTSFESSFGELGGCPVPAGATGNIATEDLVSMLHEMGISTGIDLDALLACARRVRELLGRPLGSHTLVAGPVDWR
jgi:hydroxymethylglutaryl-CoA lyase